MTMDDLSDWKKKCVEYANKKGYIMEENGSIYLIKNGTSMEEFMNITCHDDSIILYTDFSIVDNKIVLGFIKVYVKNFKEFKQQFDLLYRKHNELKFELKEMKMNKKLEEIKEDFV